MAREQLDDLLAEQAAYYRARADEYDETVPREDAARERIADALAAFAPRGEVLELACGTGRWTELLAEHADHVTALDASSEMLARSRARVARPNVRYVQADVFAWTPPRRYDLVFFAAWLSHVPPQRFEAFWALVARCLAERGRVFLVDELPAAAVTERPLPGAPTHVVERTLRDGRRYRAVKVLYEPDELQRRLTVLGWRADVQPVGRRFFYATAIR